VTAAKMKDCRWLKLMAQFEAVAQSLRSGRRVEGEKELLLFPSEPTTG
jgi:hypothetical protein